MLKTRLAGVIAAFAVLGIASAGVALAGSRPLAAPSPSAANPCLEFPKTLQSSNDGKTTWNYGSGPSQPAVAILNPFSLGWGAPVGTSTWISVSAAADPPAPSTTYYDQSFNVSQYTLDFAKLTLSGSFLADNNATVTFNGGGAVATTGQAVSNFKGPATPFSYSTSTTSPPDPFKLSDNLDFAVGNVYVPLYEGERNPGGLDFSATVTCAPNLPDLMIEKQLGTPTPWVGGDVDSFDLVISNNGPGAIPAGTVVTVTDTLPTGLTFQPPAPSGPNLVCNESGQTLTCSRTLTGLAAQTTLLPIVVNVRVNTFEQTKLTNCASVAFGDRSTPDANASNNQSCVSVPIVRPGRICVSKYWDKNGNGTQNSGEPFLSGWTFTVNTSPLTQIVIGKGKPCEYVRPGTYTIMETQKPGWIPTDPTSGGKTVTVASGQTVAAKFGNYQPLLDHYECYWASPHTFPNRIVGVRDQFNASLAPRKLVVTRDTEDTLCNPASKNGERVPNPLAHLFCYPVAKGTPFLPKTVMTTNQFGQLILRIVRPRELCLPTAKTLRPQPEIQRIPTLDHYLCYDIRQVGVRRYPTVLLVDEFGARRAAVLVADRLCAPAQKFVPGQKPTVQVDPVDHLVCYTIRTPFQPRTAYIRNQFEYRPVRAIRGRWLCVPSIKKVLLIGKPIADCKGKLKTYTQTDGRQDNFQTADGPEPATPPAMYDQTAANTDFEQLLSVPQLVGRMCSLTVEFRVKGLDNIPGNDAASLSSTYGASTQSWSQYFGKQTPAPICCSSPLPTYTLVRRSVAATDPPPLTGSTWTTGSVQTFSWTFGPAGGLPAGYPYPAGNPGGNTGAGVFTNFDLSGVLDFGVEDDTAVDYVKFTVTYE